MSVATLEAFREFLYGDEPWREKARCRATSEMTPAEVKANLSLYFPHRGQTQKPAKAMCARCPVQAECAAYADRSKSTYGIWGGEIRHRGPQPDKESNGSEDPQRQ